MKTLTTGFIFLLLFTIRVVRTDAERDGTLMFAQEGQNVTVTCHYHSEMAMHFSWYKHKLGRKPELVSTMYKYESKPTFYSEFKDKSRFAMDNGKGVTHLMIKELQHSDSATYYCGSAHSNIVEFGEGTELIVRAPQIRRFSVFHQPTVLQPVQPGDSVTLECTIFTEHCGEDHSVYWFRHAAGESRPGIIFTHGDSSSQCTRSSETVSPTQSCIYKLPKNNLSLSDAGTYYCAVAACGEILYGNGSRLDIMNNRGGDCSEHMHVLILLSIVRSAVLLCGAAVIIIYFCTNQRASMIRSSPSLHSRKSTEKIPSHSVEKTHL
ncbi:immunoglobulin alpha-2 heavy chain-like [Astyanax mexicanus]|uniref:Ig-like domain-containing protein n=1 Tax=Astyanax mexicanus TaxID=7994 RepID=A0A8B9GSG6_ASTMX|nr:immunoglobulin alpha-2 heavy chain-like [Astyanax mexicanus]